jgi:hypothetical protein
MEYTIQFANGVYNVMLQDKVLYSTTNYGAAQMYLEHMQRYN